MNFFQQFISWLGLTPRSNASPEVTAMRDALETGRRAKRAENYDQALSALIEAGQLARNIGDTLAVAVIDLHRADVLVAQKQYDLAETILAELKQDAERNRQTTQRAYVECSWGSLEQSRGNWAASRQHFEQALEVAREAGAGGAEGRAIGHLADTYLHEGNASYAIHLLRESLPKLNTSGDIELSSYFVGRLGEALISAGQEVEGQQLVGRALRLAEHMQYRMYERRWRLASAQQAQAAAAFQDAYTHYKRAIELFEGQPPSLEQVNALCQMSKTCLSLRQNQEAWDYARRASHLSATLEDKEAILLAEGVLGTVLRSLGRSAESISHLEAAAQASSGSAQIELLRNLAAAQVDSNDSDTAIVTYQRAIAQAESLNLRLELAQSRRDLGMLYARASKMQDAIQEWVAALEIYRVDNQHAQVALLHCDIGNARRFIGQGQRAIKDYENALMVLNSIDDISTRGVVLSNAANAYVDQGDLDTADSFFSEAVKIAQRLDDRRAEATRRGNYGWFLLSTGRAQRAETILEQALRMSYDLGLDLQVAVQTDNLGLVHDELGRPEKALPFHQEALELVQKLNNPHWEGVIKSNLAATMAELSQVDDAAPLYEQVLAAGRATDDLELSIRGLNGNARVALKRGEIKAAGDLLHEAVTMARRADMRRLLAEGLMLQSQYHAATGSYEQAAELWQEAKKLYTILHASQAYRNPDWLPLA
jgi:tetratricopeptide (TPR) repeat protein